MKKLIITSLVVLLAGTAFSQKKADNIQWLKQKMVKYGTIKYPVSTSSTVSQYITAEGDKVILHQKTSTYGKLDSLIENSQYTIDLNRLEDAFIYTSKEDQWFVLYFAPGTVVVKSDQNELKKLNGMVELSLNWQGEDGLINSCDHRMKLLVRQNRMK